MAATNICVQLGANIHKFLVEAGMQTATGNPADINLKLLTMPFTARPTAKVGIPKETQTCKKAAEKRAGTLPMQGNEEKNTAEP
ncbi:Hypothetical predicted protein [Pelobates cultripes]|uniref:Uncharacterized protein n=1 Tax=Pelobates cultripes TaxID=61616 RepID=A0AAD1SE94_PELCU|nr:Hypothetical predicted protein [Pelobates cultripes]